VAVAEKATIISGKFFLSQADLFDRPRTSTNPCLSLACNYSNKRYRQVVSEMKMMYRNTEAKTVKTDLSRAIVDHVCSYGGRFVKKDDETGKYYLLTKAEARKKTSQALRETKALKWTM
jgi:hypothetical protein